MDHRKHIGGAWDEIGKLQFDFLVAKGLEPHHRLLDYGCGSGRGAVHFVPYLEPCHYLGLDLDKRMLSAALMECGPFIGQHPAFMHLDQLTARAKVYDFAICQSVFTHCFPSQIAAIMRDIDSLLTDDGVLYATWFEGEGYGPLRHERGGRETYKDRDPFHQSMVFWECQPWSDQWEITHIDQSEWNHPRSQRMMEIRRKGSE